jgi:hypothetical protein
MSREKYAQLAPLTLAIGSALAVSSTQAAVITVDTLADPGAVSECSLRSAITAVNTQSPVGGCPDPSDPAADVIEFADGLSGVIELDGSPLQITESVTIAGPGAGQLSVDALGNSSVFEVASGQSEIGGLTITNGDAKYGAGVRVTGQTSLRLTDCVISGNSASSAGGGVSVVAQALQIDNCDITDNSAGRYGGGIAVLGGEAIVRNSMIADNSATDIGGGLWVDLIVPDEVGPNGPAPRTDDDGAQGPPVVASPSLNILDSVVSGNLSMLGGGVGAGRYPEDINGYGLDRELPQGLGAAPNLVVDGSLISGNTAEFGGGIGMNGYLDFGSGPLGTISWRYNRAEITGSTIAGNEAFDSGGGIASRASDLFLDLSSVAENSAALIGGGIYSDRPNILLRNDRDAGRGSDAPGLTHLLESSVYGNQVEGIILRGGGGGQGFGGGIASINAPVVSIESQISQNSSPGNAGGLLASNDAVTLIESEVSGNIGGGVGVYGGDFLSFGSHISGNFGGAVGGVNCEGVPQCDFKYSSVSNNEGSSIGGIAAAYQDPGPLEALSTDVVSLDRGGMPPPDPTSVIVFNSTVSTNQGSGPAGGIYAEFLTLEHSTVAFNQRVPGPLGRGVLAAGGVLTSQAGSVISHSIIAGNVTNVGEADLRVSDGNIAMDYSLIGSDTGFIPVGSGNLLDTDPRLQPLALNGGILSLTHAIGTESPAFDAGNPALTGPDHDQRGPDFPRKIGVIDIGAYEILIDGIFADRFESVPP